MASTPEKRKGQFRRFTALIGRGELLDKAAEQIERWLGTTHDPGTYDLTTTLEPTEGRNRLLVMTGAAAVGKSRLAYELVERLKAKL